MSTHYVARYVGGKEVKSSTVMLGTLEECKARAKRLNAHPDKPSWCTWRVVPARPDPAEVLLGLGLSAPEVNAALGRAGT